MHRPESTAYIQKSLRKNLIGLAADQISFNNQFPVETSTLIALTIASQSVSLGYKVAYRGRGTLPIGLYAIAEQPSGTGKSSIFSGLDKGFREGISNINSERIKVLKQIKQSKADKGEYNDFELEELKKNALIPLPVSNTTPEALDHELSKCGGWFCLSSTEQGLLNTLVGGMYSEGKSNFDLMLKGFNAETHRELRVTRETYQGLPHGSTLCVSQEGSIDTILGNSGSTGLVERFLMLVEGDMRGHRNKITDEKNPISYGYIDQFNVVCRDIVQNSFKDRERSLEYHELKDLHIDSIGWDLIENCQQEVEKELAPGGKYRANIFSSMWSKFDIQVMKIAATIHAFSDCDINSKISADSVLAAIAIVRSIFDGVVKICESKGIVGKSSEEEDMIEYMEKNCKGAGKSEREILNAIRRRKVFKQYGNEARQKSKDTLNSLVSKGLVQVVTTGDQTKYRFVG